MFKVIGGDYGGKVLDLDLVPEGSVVISAGIGEDMNFDVALIKEKKCKVIGIDPTEKAVSFVEKNPVSGFEFRQKALWTESGATIKLYKNTNPDHVSESILTHHRATSNEDYHEAETVSLQDLIKEYGDKISVLKLDIEGAEYALFESEEILTILKRSKIPQLVCEFHHFCSNYSIEDTKRCIENLKAIGYSFWIPKNQHQPMVEMTFIHKDAI